MPPANSAPILDCGSAPSITSRPRGRPARQPSNNCVGQIIPGRDSVRPPRPAAAPAADRPPPPSRRPRTANATVTASNGSVAVDDPAGVTVSLGRPPPQPPANHARRHDRNTGDAVARTRLLNWPGYDQLFLADGAATPAVHRHRDGRSSAGEDRTADGSVPTSDRDTHAKRVSRCSASNMSCRAAYERRGTKMCAEKELLRLDKNDQEQCVHRSAHRRPLPDPRLLLHPRRRQLRQGLIVWRDDVACGCLSTNCAAPTATLITTPTVHRQSRPSTVDLA